MRAGGLALILALVALVAGCGGGSSSGEPDSAVGSATSTASAPASDCREAGSPPVKRVQLERPALKPPPAGSTVTFETTCGSFTVKLDPGAAPRTTASFAYLVRRGFYEMTAFHRIAPGFVVQGGDPLAGDPQRAGTGGPGYSVTEKPDPRTSYTLGIVAMAKSAVEPPGTSGSQFFVVTGADAGLPPDYAVIGKVSQGFPHVRAIESLATSTDGPPARPVVIEKATLHEG